MMEWIKLEEKQPDSDGPLKYEDCRFLVYGKTTCRDCCRKDVVFEARWRRTAREFEYGEYDCPVDAKFWMPLPKPPHPFDEELKKMNQAMFDGMLRTLNASS